MVSGSGTGAADPSITSLAQVAATLGLIQPIQFICKNHAYNDSYNDKVIV
jgi:hypothetical protein